MIDDLVSSALLGTARMPPPATELVTSPLDPDPAAALLAAAALEFAFQRGCAGTAFAAPPTPAPDDERLLLPDAAAHRLGELLATRSPLLPEWFALAHRYRAPARLVAPLLAFATAQPEHRGDIMTLTGPRGRWLAAQNPDWRDLIPYRADDTEPWTHGTPRERRRWLTEVRALDPAAASAALTATWQQETGADRAALLAILEANPLPADEELLELALDDSRRDVRAAAAHVLIRHPESAYAQRMSRRAQAWITYRRGELTVAPVLDDSARRDGLADDAVRLLASATPLDRWPSIFGSPQAAVAAESPWRADFLAGWSRAAVAQRNAEWANLLLAQGRTEVLPAATPNAVTAYVLTLDSALSERPNPFAALPHPWPAEAVTHFLRLALDRAGHAVAELRRTRANSPAAAQPALRAAAAHMPVDAVRSLRMIAQQCPDPAWGRALHELGQALIIRTTMLEELM